MLYLPITMYISHTDVFASKRKINKADLPSLTFKAGKIFTVDTKNIIIETLRVLLATYYFHLKIFITENQVSPTKPLLQ